MKRVFVDTGGFIGLLADDASHARARELFVRADAKRWRLVTTNAVVFETYSVLLIRSRDARRMHDVSGSDGHRHVQGGAGSA